MAVDCAFSVWNAIVSVAGIVAGGLIGFFSARNISDRNIFSAAGAKLRASFVQSQLCLSNGRADKKSPNDINHDRLLSSELPKIAEAIEEFRHFVSECSAARYQEAWDDYYQSIKTGGVMLAQAYDEADPWSVIEKKIHVILNFTKP